MRAFTCLAVSAVFLVVPFSAASARANVYRCVSPGGQVSYQQFPCHSDDAPIKLRDPGSGWSPLRPGERALLDSYRKEAAERRRKRPTAQKKVPKESPACWNRRKQLEAVRAKLRRGYTLNESDKLHRKRNNYEDYLRQFCS
ncbi:MAG TPA: hypothetical protein ENJ80_05400 [Gammaproteobacteria bacterium]|nr:hypothetical protein [Gammaproteobacteria bacterium]